MKNLWKIGPSATTLLLILLLLSACGQKNPAVSGRYAGNFEPAFADKVPGEYVMTFKVSNGTIRQGNLAIEHGTVVHVFDIKDEIGPVHGITTLRTHSLYLDGGEKVLVFRSFLSTGGGTLTIETQNAIITIPTQQSYEAGNVISAHDKRSGDPVIITTLTNYPEKFHK